MKTFNYETRLSKTLTKNDFFLVAPKNYDKASLSKYQNKKTYSFEILTLSSAAVFKTVFYGILCEANHKKAT
jgi:hypothetical protein